MKKNYFILLLAIAPFFSNAQDFFKRGRLMVSADGHYLQYEDGTPFFWLGDTGWEMLHLLTREEIAYYLKVRKLQGFTVIQTVAVSEFKGLTSPNAYGMLPFADRDPAHIKLTPGKSLLVKGQYDSWDHVDFAVDEAEKQGLYMALLPCWGEYVTPREGNRLFTTAEQAYNYGNFIGKRYSHKKNIIWILGGDRLPVETPDGIALWRAMAKGIADGTNNMNDINGKTDYTTTLMTYHCFQSSSTWFQHDEWLDLNMWGSYHDNFSNTRAFEQVYQDESLPVVKPTINGEPSYEEHPVNWLPSNGYFTAYDARQMAYWSVFAGACGHTYGCNPIWQFYDKSRPSNYLAYTPWKKALFDDGAVQMKYLKNLMECRPVPGRKPANDIIAAGEGVAADHCVATKGKQYAFIYVPTGRAVTVRLKQIGADVKAWWYNPRTGKAMLISVYRNQELQQFAPPGISDKLQWLKTGRGCDWVLVLDDAAAGFAAPGQVSLY